MESEAGSLRWNRDHEFVKAWTAYLRPSVLSAIAVALGWALSAWSWRVGAAVITLALVRYVYRVLMIRSVILFTNADGVWVHEGIFPWSRGYHGVKWRDVDEASTFLGFFSWAFKAYTVKLTHRYTRASELYLTHIRHGDQAVAAINRALMAKAATG
jgi:hypothetical protein